MENDKIMTAVLAVIGSFALAFGVVTYDDKGFSWLLVQVVKSLFTQ